MIITDTRQNLRQWFKCLLVGDIFEYLESFYIKTGVSADEPNAVDLLTGTEDIIGLNVEVDVLDAELIVKEKGAK